MTAPASDKPGKRTLAQSIQDSRAKRDAMSRRFGFVPMSVLRLSRGALSRQMYCYQSEFKGRSVTGSGTAGYRNAHTDHGRAMAVERRELGVQFGGRVNVMRGASSMGASIMPAELPDFFIRYYAKPGDVYLDPFMGQGIQMQVAHLRRLTYWGYDLCEDYFAYIDAVRARIVKPDDPHQIHVHHGDSRHPDKVPDGVGDFSFHSPPYWDVEHYSDDPRQLGLDKSYDEFMSGIEDVYRAWLPKFKPGAFHVVNVNDIRRKGAFIPYHADTIAALTRAGWVLHDTWVIEGLVTGMTRVFAVDKNLSRIAPKVHEFAIVVRAPGGKP